MANIHAMIFPPDTMKPLPQLPITKTTFLQTVIEKPELEQQHSQWSPQPPPKSTPYRQLSLGPPRRKPVPSAQPRIQRAVTAPGHVPTVSSNTVAHVYVPSTAEFQIPLAPAPLKIKKSTSSLASPPPVPQHSAVTSKPSSPFNTFNAVQNQIPQSNIELIVHPYSRVTPEHVLDHLPSIQTRLDAWIQANQHHAELEAEPVMPVSAHRHSPRSCSHRCEVCPDRTIGLAELPDTPLINRVPTDSDTTTTTAASLVMTASNSTGSTTSSQSSPTTPVSWPLPTTKMIIPDAHFQFQDQQDYNYNNHSHYFQQYHRQVPTYDHEEKEVVLHVRGMDHEEAHLEMEVKEKKSGWAKPSFKGFLVKVGSMKTPV